MRLRLRAVWMAALCVCLALATSATADVRLPKVIGDHMVLQQGGDLPIWGWADAGEDVTVSLGGQKVAAKAGADGRWQVRLKPLKAGGPLKMTVAGKNTLKVADILVGEVWVCSGQSNMQMSVRSSANAAADYPKIRLFTVPNVTATEPQDDCKGQWVACSPQTVEHFSAAGYFFGRMLHKDLDVPLGLINTSWGGTPSEAWTSQETVDAVADFKPIVDRFDQAAVNYAKAKEDWEKTRDEKMAKWKEAVEKAKADGKREPGQPRPPDDPSKSPHRPTSLYNGMLAPLIPYRIAGAIWYQGETNAGRAYQYRVIFPAMIKDWWTHWGQGEFPFLFVQLANFMARKDQPADSAWAELREAQSMTLALPKTGQAVIIDIGDARDIHPKNKQDVGKRLALAAEKIAYGKDIVYSGPVYDSMAVEGDKVRLKFKHVGGGLVAQGGTLKGFAVAGEDKKFAWADATIDGPCVVVANKDVAKPVAVRYAWADNPECNLYNKESLPASPFRTDEWPGVTINGK
ncbi:MAG TPA: sialate O-acetylesterase [Phycisphaerae bacterium]|nr:sialate O-acetylesterase [Phycisphaerae bacterium]